MERKTIFGMALFVVLLMGNMTAAAQNPRQQQYKSPEETKAYKNRPAETSKKPQIKAYDLYLGAGYTVGSFSGVTFVASGVLKNHDLQVNYTLGLSKTPTLYWYDAQGDVDGSLRFKRNSLEMKYGYQFLPWKPLALTPQAGFSYERLTGSQQTGLYDKGNGADAWCVAVGFKAVYTPVRHLNIFVAPEYKIPIRENAYYKDVMSTTDKASGGFAIHMGLMYSFQFKAKGGKK